MAQRNSPAERVSAFVDKKGIAAWEVQVDSDTEISKHNHEAIKLIFDSCRGAIDSSLGSPRAWALDGYEDEHFRYQPISVEAA
ncbi:hypothetical protein L917_08276, partial [Phytophthora nicotianae]